MTSTRRIERSAPTSKSMYSFLPDTLQFCSLAYSSTSFSPKAPHKVGLWLKPQKRRYAIHWWTLLKNEYVNHLDLMELYWFKMLFTLLLECSVINFIRKIPVCKLVLRVHPWLTMVLNEYLRRWNKFFVVRVLYTAKDGLKHSWRRFIGICTGHHKRFVYIWDSLRGVIKVQRRRHTIQADYSNPGWVLDWSTACGGGLNVTQKAYKPILILHRMKRTSNCKVEDHVLMNQRTTLKSIVK